MKKFLVKFFKFTLSIIIVSAVFTMLIFKLAPNDHYKENELKRLVQKLDGFQNDTNQYNTVFIGTSRSYRHISPAVFDSITGKRSYNLSFEGLYPFRLYDVIDKYIRTSPKYKGIQNVFIEIAPLDAVAENYNNNAFVNSITLKKYITAVTSVYTADFPLKNKLFYIYYYTKLCIYKYLGFGIINRINQCLGLNKNLSFTDSESVKYSNVMKQNSGFLSLNDEQLLFKNNKVSPDRKNFIKNAASILKDFKKYPHLGKHSKDDRFTEYIATNAVSLQKEGKRVYFILPPRQLEFSMRYLLSQKEILVKKGFNVLDFSDPAKYPDFYLLNNSFDKTHLNAKGARIYSETLSRQMLNR